jgi:hypothetical protein
LPTPFCDLCDRNGNAGVDLFGVEVSLTDAKSESVNLSVKPRLSPTTR